MKLKLNRVALLWLLAALLLWAGGPGFRSRRQFEEHCQKHGAEFGSITALFIAKLALSPGCSAALRL